MKFKIKIIITIMVSFVVIVSMCFFIVNRNSISISGFNSDNIITGSNNSYLITLKGVPSGNGMYQQLITINNYSKYGINGDGSNIAFYDGSNLTHLYAWIQFINITTIQIWVKNFNGSSIINMQVLYSFENLFSSSGYLGEAPQLSSIYAEYDNGRYVFPYYWDFAGTSLPSGINSITSDGSITVNDGVTIKGGTLETGGENGIYTSTSFSAPIIVEYYGTQTSSPKGDIYGWNIPGFANFIGTSDSSPPSGGSYEGIDFEEGNYGSVYSSQGGISHNGVLSNPSNNTFPNSIWEQIYTHSTYYTYQNGINNTGYLTNASINLSLPFEIMVGNNEGTYAPNGMTVYWIRALTYVPTMPTFTIGTGNSTAFTHEIILESD